MSTVMSSPAVHRSTSTPGRFLVLWQHPETRAFHHIGRLSRSDGCYRFAYNATANEVPGFEPLANFPDFHRTYESQQLFPVFANRVMTVRRDGYADYVAALGLGPTPEPFEVLARTLGTRETDRIQVLPVPDPTPDGRIELVFLVHGTRHVDPTGERLSRLHPGDPLYIAPEESNPFNPRALLVAENPTATRATSLGYVPDALVIPVRRIIADSTQFDVRVERINPAAGLLPDSMRLLARLQAQVEPGFDIGQAATTPGANPVGSAP